MCLITQLFKWKQFCFAQSTAFKSNLIRLDIISGVVFSEVKTISFITVLQVASGECNEDTEVYNITLSTGDELTLMGQAEILYAKSSKEKSRLNTIFKKIGKLNSISKLGRGKMPCLICMNHRTNESISLPFQCKGKFSTRSPLEVQMQEGEHTIRNIVEKTRLPVNVTVPSPTPRNPYDLHFIREGHRYKFVNIQTKTVVVCCVLRGNKIIPMHFPLHLALPKFTLPDSLVKGELWHESLIQHWFNICQEQFDIDEYSRAVRDVKTDWNEDCKSPKKSRCSGHTHVPNSLSYARDELTQSFHRLSVCVYGNNLHGNSEVNLHGCRDLCNEWALFSHDALQYQDSGDSSSDYLFPEVGEESMFLPTKPELPYEELWLDQGSGKPGEQPLTRSLSEKNKCDNYRGSFRSKCGSTSLPVPGTVDAATKSADVSLPPPPVPPKSEAVSQGCLCWFVSFSADEEFAWEFFRGRTSEGVENMQGNREKRCATSANLIATVSHILKITQVYLV